METLVHEKPDMTTRPLRHLAFPKTTHRFSHPRDECPACHSGAMCWIANKNPDYNYLCEACGRCWSWGPAGAIRVNPVSCSDCDYKDVCLEQIRKEIAGSWWLTSGR